MRELLLAPLLLIVLLGLLCYAYSLLAPYPELDTLEALPSSKEYADRFRVPIYVEPADPSSDSGIRRMVRSLDEYPEAMVQAFLAAEDADFYLHPGLNSLAILRSAVLNLQAGRIVSGASTITMQLARILAMDAGTRPPGRMHAKIRECLDALKLEQRLSKEEILEAYLNTLPFGHRCRGAYTAAYTFFDRSPRDLQPEHFLLLSVIPRSPERYNPVRRPESAVRAAVSLNHLYPYPVTAERLEAAAAEANYSSWENRAPHFVRHLSSHSQGNRRIRSSLDLELNQYIKHRIDTILGTYSANRLGNGAAVVLDNRSGEILAWVGSRNFHDIEHRGQIDGVLAQHQPGSTLKPFLYTMAIEQGFLPNSILPDIPMEFGGREVYLPMNFDRRYHGPVRLRVALASSLNIPAVYLINRLGVMSFADYLIGQGFQSIQGQKGHLGSGLALGNAEVSLLELVRGYTLFSRGDRPVTIHSSYLSGEELQQQESGMDKLSPRQAYAIAVVRDILGDKKSRFLGFGGDTVMNLPFPSLFKTGTANQFQNIWAVGAVPDYTVGVWIGNFTGETVIGETGSSIPASIVADLLHLLYRPGSEYPPIPGAVKQRICSVSGMAATEADPSSLWEYLPREEIPPPCTWHRRNMGEGVELRYPDIYRSWAQEQGLRVSGRWESSLGDAEMISPRDGAHYYLDPGVGRDDQGLRVEALFPGEGPFRMRLYSSGSLVEDTGFVSDLPKFFLRMPDSGSYRIKLEELGGQSVESRFRVD